MKTVAVTCVYNDPEYLDIVLESTRGFFDEHFVIEGAWKSSQNVGASPRSGQETLDIIKKHSDHVTYVAANEKDEPSQRQLTLELAKEAGADWCYIVDSDEVYPHKTMVAIKNLMRAGLNNPVINGYKVCSYNFINSFKKWYNGEYVRILKVSPEMKFTNPGNFVTWSDRPEGRVCLMPNNLKFFHYNYVKQDPDHFWLKLNFLENQDPHFTAEKSKYDYKDGKYKIPDDCRIYDYTGKHPLIMQNHPYFKNDIFNDGEFKYE